MQLPCDAHPLLAASPPGLGELLPCQLLGLLAAAGLSGAALPDRVADQPGADNRQAALQHDRFRLVGSAPARHAVAHAAESGTPSRGDKQRAGQQPQRVPVPEPQRDQVHTEGRSQGRKRVHRDRDQDRASDRGDGEDGRRPAPPASGRQHRYGGEQRGGPRNGFACSTPAPGQRVKQRQQRGHPAVDGGLTPGMQPESALLHGFTLSALVGRPHRTEGHSVASDVYHGPHRDLDVGPTFCLAGGASLGGASQTQRR